MSQQGDEEIKTEQSTFEDDKNPETSKVGPFMCALFEKQLYTDVTFCSIDNKEFISAHRAVMAAKCDFFENLLFGDQKKEGVAMEMQVEISNVPFSVFKNIVKYFYTDKIEFTDDYTILEIYSAAKSFHIQHLIDKSKIYLESMEIRADNVCSMLQVCNTKNVEELKSRCISFIQKSTFKVISSTDFLTCSFRTILEICDLEPLNLQSEVKLLEAVLRWINHQPKHTKEELTKSLLKNIRFLSFTSKEFSEMVQRHTDLLTPEEGLKILVYLNSSTSDALKALPKWCNRSQRSFKGDQMKIGNDMLQQYSKRRRVNILLKPTKETQNITNRANLLFMKCFKGIYQIKSIKFSFEDIKNDKSFLADLVIKAYVKPKGLTYYIVFLENHSVNQSESSFIFPQSITVAAGQQLKFDISAKINQSGKFLQFDKYLNSNLDFFCKLVSRPYEGKLNFISEVEYEPLEILESDKAVKGPKT